MKSITLFHPSIGRIKVLEKTYLIHDNEFQINNAKLVIDILLGLGFRRIE